MVNTTVFRIALIICLAGVLAVAGCTPPSGPTAGPPAAPVLLGVLDGTCAEIPAGTSGGFRLLPRQGVVLRVAAAWPSADLTVRANGIDLDKVGPSDTGRQQQLRDVGYWVPQNIDPNPAPPAWTVEVMLPKGMREGPVALSLVSGNGGASSAPLTVQVVKDIQATAATPRRVDLAWRDRGNEMGYLLERSTNGGPYVPLVSIGKDATGYADTQTRGNRKYTYRLTAQSCGALGAPPSNGTSASEGDVTTPKETGADDITLFRSNLPGDDQFVYVTPLPLFDPEDALVTNVTNISEDENGRGVRLELVRHLGRSLPAANCATAAPLEPSGTTTVFNGLPVQGEWKVRAVCISQAFLDDPPARIALRIDWSQ